MWGNESKQHFLRNQVIVRMPGRYFIWEERSIEQRIYSSSGALPISVIKQQVIRTASQAKSWERDFHHRGAQGEYRYFTLRSSSLVCFFNWLLLSELLIQLLSHFLLPHYEVKEWKMTKVLLTTLQTEWKHAGVETELCAIIFLPFQFRDFKLFAGVLTWYIIHASDMHHCLMVKWKLQTFNVL